jgi:hypothetical protein
MATFTHIKTTTVKRHPASRLTAADGSSRSSCPVSTDASCLSGSCCLSDNSRSSELPWTAVESFKASDPEGFMASEPIWSLKEFSELKEKDRERGNATEEIGGYLGNIVMLVEPLCPCINVTGWRMLFTYRHLGLPSSEDKNPTGKSLDQPIVLTFWIFFAIRLSKAHLVRLPERERAGILET